MATMGINEIKWAKQCARPRINPHRSVDLPEHPKVYISLLERYLQIVPYLSSQDAVRTLSHHDLHLDNIFVDPRSANIACVMDWQSTSIREAYFQQEFPRMLHPVQRIASDKPHDNGKADNDDLLQYYRYHTELSDGQWWKDLNFPCRSLLTRPVSTLSNAWETNSVVAFRDSLIDLVVRWGEIAKDGEACPISFSMEELDAHRDESEIVEGLDKILNQLQDESLLPLGGMVRRDRYENYVKLNDHVKEMFVNLAPTESQKDVFSRVWPY